MKHVAVIGTGKISATRPAREIVLPRSDYQLDLPPYSQDARTKTA
jgi:hypothetical protein